MYRILSASKDTYITNKIISNKFRATDANVGQAGTLDLFKLYAESVTGSNSTPYEDSRILLYFNLSDVATMHNNGIIDVGSNTFKAYLKLHDVYGGQTTPNNFKIIAFPLSKSFDEGIGFDIVNFSDLDATNYITASILNNTVDLWNTPGAKKSGSLGEENIDVIVSGTLSGQSVNFSSEQFFASGEEDLKLDVTNFVSASVKNLIDNHGFLIGFSGSYETNNKTYFVKRFASKDAANQSLRPSLTIEYEDSIIDNHQNFEFDTTGSLYLNNFNRGILTNIVSGSAASEIAGNNCLFLKIESGSFKKIFTGSQVKRGENSLTGIYSASFAISSFDSLLYNAALQTGSITFNEVWTNDNETVTYLSSSLKINKNEKSGINFREKRYLASILNLKSKYNINEFTRIRVFIQNSDREITYVKKPFELKSEIFSNMFYRVRDVNSGKIIIPFIESSTKLSSDNLGMYFDFYMSSLPQGRSYTFDFKIKIDNFDIVIKDIASNFLIE